MTYVTDGDKSEFFEKIEIIIVNGFSVAECTIATVYRLTKVKRQCKQIYNDEI